MSQNLQDLVPRAQHGDRAAFEELVRCTSRLLLARLYLETGDLHQAEDLLQETFLKAFRSLRQLKDPANVRSWLLTIAHNVAVEAARRESRQKRQASGRKEPNRLALIPGKEATPEEMSERTELRQRVLAVIRSLPEEYQLPVMLRYLSGDDYQSIQNQLGITNGSLRGLLYRGLKILRERLEPEFGDLSAE